MKKNTFLIFYAFILTIVFTSCTSSEDSQILQDETTAINRATFNALLFDAREKQYAIVEEHHIGDNMPGDFSIEIIFNQDRIYDPAGHRDPYHMLFSCNSHVPQHISGFYSFVRDNGQLFFIYGNDYNGDNNQAGIYATEKGTIKDNECYHISYVKKRDNFKIYVNGHVVLSERIFHDDNFRVHAPLVIGGSWYDYENRVREHFTGRIDELRFFKYALDDSFIEENLFREIDDNTDGLLAYYKFKNDGQRVVDYTGYGNDGYLGLNDEDLEYDPKRVGEQCER